MRLLDRIHGGMPEGSPRVAIHALVAEMCEASRDEKTTTAVKDRWSLDAISDNDQKTIVTKLADGKLTRARLKDILYLVESGFYSVAEGNALLGLPK